MAKPLSSVSFSQCSSFGSTTTTFLQVGNGPAVQLGGKAKHQGYEWIWMYGSDAMKPERLSLSQVVSGFGFHRLHAPQIPSKGLSDLSKKMTETDWTLQIPVCILMVSSDNIWSRRINQQYTFATNTRHVCTLCHSWCNACVRAPLLHCSWTVHDSPKIYYNVRNKSAIGIGRLFLFDLESVAACCSPH